VSVKHAVLGLVIERPGYGYQLAVRLQERCGSWRWEPSGVYGALDSLSDDGYVVGVREKGSGQSGRAAPRLVYEATPSGVAFFRDWMAEASTPSPVRQELDLKILFCEPAGLPQIIDQTWSHEQICIDDLKALTNAMPAGAPELRTWQDAKAPLQRDAEIRLLQVRIEWLQNAREVMQRMISQSTGAGEMG